jgi:hypothetical protein
MDHLGRSEATMFPRAVLSNSNRITLEIWMVVSLVYRQRLSILQACLRLDIYNPQAFIQLGNQTVRAAK